MYDIFLLDTLPRQQASIASHSINGERVWLKRAAKRNSKLAYAPLRLLATWLKLDVLKPVPNLGGHKSIETEVSRITALRRAGIAVPRVLATMPDALLLADAGSAEQPARTLIDRLKHATSVDEVDRTLAMSLASLNQVHARDCYLSEAFARNILVTNEQAIFIDFETDPGEVHSPVDCMVRDWYCLIFSLYGKLHKSPMQLERLTPAIAEGLKHARSDVVERFKQALPTLLKMRKIPFKLAGSDGRKIHVTLQSLAALNQRL